MRWSIAPLALVALAIMLPGLAFGHAERPSYFPDHRLGKVPKYRTSGPSLVVCKSDSASRIRKMGGKGKRARAARQRNLALLERCEHRHIQAAVDDARNGTRILVLPGV